MSLCSFLLLGLFTRGFGLVESLLGHERSQLPKFRQILSCSRELRGCPKGPRGHLGSKNHQVTEAPGEANEAEQHLSVSRGSGGPAAVVLLPLTPVSCG